MQDTASRRLKPPRFGKYSANSVFKFLKFAPNLIKNLLTASYTILSARFNDTLMSILDYLAFEIISPPVLLWNHLFIIFAFSLQFKFESNYQQVMQF